jgi:hypothetical protein
MEVNHDCDVKHMERKYGIRRDGRVKEMNEAKGTCHSCYVSLMTICHDNVARCFSQTYLDEI